MAQIFKIAHMGSARVEKIYIFIGSFLSLSRYISFVLVVWVARSCSFLVDLGDYKQERLAFGHILNRAVMNIPTC